MLQRGGGEIVNTFSDSTIEAEPRRVAYACSKAGVNVLWHIASRWGKENIRCNAVSPRVVMSEAAQATASDEFNAQIAARLRSSRMGRPTDPAAMVTFLLSDDGAWINGQVIQVNGGAGLRD